MTPRGDKIIKDGIEAAAFLVEQQAKRAEAAEQKLEDSLSVLMAIEDILTNYHCLTFSGQRRYDPEEHENCLWCQIIRMAISAQRRNEYVVHSDSGSGRPVATRLPRPRGR